MWGLESFFATPLIADSIITFAIGILRRDDYLGWLAKARPNIKAAGRRFKPDPQRLDYWHSKGYGMLSGIKQPAIPR
jgi:hypothetical protein